MKLFVDDIRNAPDESWTVARTVNAAISAIDTFDFDEISLDHDISHQIMMGSSSRPYPCDETFMAVAYFIKHRYKWEIMAREMKEEHRIYTTCLNIDCPERRGGICKHMTIPIITIHTANPAGAVRLESVLSDFPIRLKEYGPANRLETEV